MERWRGKVAVVTGASAGIGLAIAKSLIREGLTVVGLARRKEKMLNEMKSVKGPGKFIARECDVSKEKDIDEAFDYVKDTFKTIHILINNAGIVKINTIEDSDLKDMQQVINVNFVALVHCSKRAIKLMKEGGHEAHIININSTAGHKVPNVVFPDGKRVDLNVYSPTKFAVTSISEVLTNELLGSKIRVTSISPGYVKTEIGGDDIKSISGKEENKVPALNAEDIADAVVYIVGTPHHVQITELKIRPLGEYF
ncbi:farnesol dehydrogenase-like [Phymastichus coffea]|uniref:farnesol dehydrogenase-like n=1 Tax=Phymastichus coffea TaxID=108790 RepID=UPI00273B6021|nr:farnesol dehydrogenase-like [Phymastichus coffea]